MTDRHAADDIAHYRAQGYVLVPGPLLPQVDFDALTTRFEHLLSSAPPDVRPEHLDVPHFHDPGLFRWLLHPAVLDAVEPLIGPDIALFSSHFICKPGGDGRRVPWHEDSAYWDGMFSREDMQVATVWLAIDPSDEGNGAMRVIPGTHRGGYSSYDPVPDADRSVFTTEIRSGLYDASRAVTIALAANHASVHHAKLMHGSARNTSPRRRCGFTMRYVSTRCRFNHERCGAYHQLYLARGRDWAGNVYGDPEVAATGLVAARGQRIRAGH